MCTFSSVHEDADSVHEGQEIQRRAAFNYRGGLCLQTYAKHEEGEADRYTGVLPQMLGANTV